MAQITITVPDTALPRVRAALRDYFPSGIDPENPPNSYPEPTDAQYLAKLKELLRDRVIQEVRDWETRSAVRNAELGITNIEGVE